jgi:hypothetical protein
MRNFAENLFLDNSLPLSTLSPSLSPLSLSLSLFHSLSLSFSIRGARLSRSPLYLSSLSLSPLFHSLSYNLSLTVSLCKGSLFNFSRYKTKFHKIMGIFIFSLNKQTKLNFSITIFLFSPAFHSCLTCLFCLTCPACLTCLTCLTCPTCLICLTCLTSNTNVYVLKTCFFLNIFFWCAPFGYLYFSIFL